MTIVQDKTFKTVHLSLYFLEKIEEDAFAYRFLLARLLTSYTKTFDTKKKLIDAFANLYGAFVSSQIFMLGSFHVLRFTLVFPNPSLVEDEFFVDQLMTLIEEMFFNREPFKKEIFNEVKRYSIEHIQTKKDRKFEYAKEEMMRHTFSGHPYALPISGPLGQIRQMSASELYDYYEHYFLNNHLKIYASGDISSNFEERLLALEKYESTKIVLPVEVPLVEKVMSNHQGQLSMNQSMIFLGYQLPIERTDKLYVAAQVTSLLLGGYPDSLLFKKIREEMMLAYDVEAHFEYDKKYLFIYAGVNVDEKTYAFDSLIDLVNNFIFDGPSLAELETAKQFLKNQVLTSLDHQQSVIPRHFLGDLFLIKDNLNTFLERLNKVSIADIKAVLSMMQLTTTYVLSGEDHEI